MKTNTKYTMRMAAVALALAGALAPAGLAQTATDASEKRQQLDEKQGQLNRRLNHVDQVGQRHGRYVLVRDTYLYGPEGVATLADAWFGKAATWTAGWSRLLAYFEEATPANLERLDVQQGIRAELKRQQDEWTALKTQALAVGARAASAQAELDALEPLPEDFVPSFGAHVALLNDQVAQLDAALAKASAGFKGSDHAVWDKLAAETETAVVARLKKAMLQYPELQRALARVELFFRAERELEPVVRGVQGTFGELRDHLLRKRRYHGSDSLAQLRTVAAAALVKVTQTGIDAEFANPARAEINAVLAAGERLWTDSTRSLTPGAHVAAYTVEANRRFAAMCRHAEQRKQVNCDVLRTLAVLPPLEVARMPVDQLRYLELQYDKVAAGPLTERARQ